MAASDSSAPWCDGKVVLVTGSSSGIGEGIALHFARLGAKVVVTGRNEGRVQQVAEQCQQISPTKQKPLAIVADLAVNKDIERLINETINEFGQIDVLVNNAGCGKVVSGIFDLNLMDAYNETMQTNLNSVVYICHLAAAHLIKSQGAIINISSGAAKKPFPSFLPYCLSKCALDMFTKCLALELGPQGVRVLSVNPAMVDTPIFERMGIPKTIVPTMIQTMSNQYPLRRIGRPEDVAYLVEFLASPKASWITGVNVDIDGGALLQTLMPQAPNRGSSQ